MLAKSTYEKMDQVLRHTSIGLVFFKRLGSRDFQDLFNQ